MNAETTRTDARAIARRLGVSEELVCRLQARGVLRRLELTDAEIRGRLHDAHVRAVQDRPRIRLS